MVTGLFGNPSKFTLIAGLLTALSISAQTAAFAGQFPGKGNEQDWLKACAICNQSTRLFQSGQVEAGLKGLDQAIAIYPFDPIFYYDAGVAHQQLSYMAQNQANKAAELEKARQFLDQAAKIDPERKDTWLHLANTQCDLGLLSDGLKSYETALKLPGLEGAERNATIQAIAVLKAKLGDNSSNNIVNSSGNLQSTNSSAAPSNALSSNQSSSTSNWQSYKNENGVSLSHPSGWQTTTSADGRIDVSNGSGASLTIVPFYVYGKVLEGAECPRFFKAMLKNVQDDNWSEPVQLNKGTYKSSCRKNNLNEIAAAVMVNTPQATLGRLCISRLPENSTPELTDNFARILGSMTMVKNTGSNLPRMGQMQNMSQMQSMNQMPAQMSPLAMQTPLMGFHTFMDPTEGAYTVDVPVGWNVQGGTDHPIAIDARPWVVAKSPDTLVTAFIGDGKIGPYYMPTSLGMSLGNLPGMKYNSGTISAYVPAQKYIVDYAVKHLKQGGCTKIEVGPVVDLPQLAKQMIGMGTQANAASVTLTCLNKDKIPYTAYFVACTKALVSNGSGMWWVTLIGGEVAPADRYQIGLVVIKRMLDTYNITAQWSNNAAHTAGQVSRIYKAGADAVERTIVDGYWARQGGSHTGAARDPLQGFDDYIRGQQTLQDPDTGTNYKVGYGNNWINQSGTVLQSDTQIGPDWRQLVAP